ncbi:AMP-binding protein, partial [Lentzea sp. NPDC060358]|uniref:non-ribosomal peptide synthetase n=1 Tax=Lentzea sp. NPDC060358 TaxID=3347103 RepID=UPI003654DFF0
AALGTMAAGAAYVHVEPSDPDPHVASVLAATGASAVLTDRANHRRPAAATVPSCVLDDEKPSAPYVPPDDLGTTDLAYLVLTSGSTGTPKAVEVEHGALLDYCAAFSQEIAPQAPDSYGITTTFAADLGKTCVYGALLSGARLDVYNRETTLDAAAFAAELQAHPVACLKFTPSHLEVLASETDLGGLLPSRLLLVAGEPFPPRLAAAVLTARPDLAVYNSYGPAETTVAVLMHRVTEADLARERIPVGHPLRGVTIRLTGRDGREAAPGTAGVLTVSGTCVARGYRGDAALTGTRFGTDGAVRSYRTDDLLVSHDGSLEFLGRADRQLKIRGNRVEPAEVEAALLALPGVRQAVAAGVRQVPDAPLELVAYVVGAVRPADLAGRLHGTLPAALVPSRMHVVTSIPLGPNGKADVEALRAAAEAEQPATVRTELPRTDVERQITEIWSAVLGRTGIGRNDRFLEIGGDSFKLLAVFGKLRRSFPAIGIATLFAHPSIAELASVLETGGRPHAPAAPAVPVVEL